MFFSTTLTVSTLGYIDPATGSIIIGAVAAGGAGVAAAAASGKARLKSVFGRGKSTYVKPDTETDDSTEDELEATDRDSAESR